MPETLRISRGPGDNEEEVLEWAQPAPRWPPAEAPAAPAEVQAVGTQAAGIPVAATAVAIRVAVATMAARRNHPAAMPSQVEKPSRASPRLRPGVPSRSRIWEIPLSWST